MADLTRRKEIEIAEFLGYRICVGIDMPEFPIIAMPDDSRKEIPLDGKFVTPLDVIQLWQEGAPKYSTDGYAWIELWDKLLADGLRIEIVASESITMVKTPRFDWSEAPTIQEAMLKAFWAVYQSELVP